MTSKGPGVLAVVRGAGPWFLVPALVVLVTGTLIAITLRGYVADRRAYAAACRGAPWPTCCDVCGERAVAAVQVEGWIGRTHKRYVKENRPVCTRHRHQEPWSVRNAAFDRDSILSHLGVLFPAGFFLVLGVIFAVTSLRQVRENLIEQARE